jgi:hypothetical protein
VSRSGVGSTPATGSRRGGRLGAVNLLLIKGLTPVSHLVTYREDCPVRYKMTALRNILSWWVLYPCLPGVRYKRTSRQPRGNCYFEDATFCAWPSHRQHQRLLIPHDHQTPALSSALAPDPAQLQLGRPSPGAPRPLPACRSPAWSLYLFLVTVADAEGLSYYSDRAIGRHLQMDPDQMAAARQQLVGADLLAFAKPLYQVLSLPEEGGRIVPTAAAPRSGQVQSVAEVLRRALEGGRL